MSRPPTAPAAERLPVRQKLLFGFGDWGNTTLATVFMFFFAFFLTDIARLDPLYAAPVLLVGGIWDAVNDPLIGVLADRVHTRWGRRRPFFLFGAIPFSLTFILLFSVPPLHSQAAKAIYYGLAYILFDTAFTAVSVPYASLTPELTQDYDERTRLNGYRTAVSMAGGLIAAVAVPLITGQFADKPAGYFVMAVMFAGLAAVPYFALFFGIRERFQDTGQSQLNILTGFRYTFRNHAFRYAAGIYLMSWATIGLAAAMFQYYLTYCMNMAGQLEIVLGLVQASALVFVPVVVWLGNRLGKQAAYLIAVGWWSLVMLTLAFLPASAQPLAYVLAVCAGLGIASAHVIPWSIIPDVIEADELETGQRREGTYYGFLVFLQKTGQAFILAFAQWFLAATGYTAGAAQSPSTLLAIRALMGPVPVVMLLASMFLMARYPISRARHAALRKKLAERREEAP